MRTFTFLIPVLILVSCNSYNKPGNKEVGGRDTLMSGNTIYYLDSISEREFKTVNETNYKADDIEVIDDTTHVKRDSSKIIFHLSNGVDSVLVNDTTDDWSKYIDYTYIESCKNMEYWLIGVTYYEGSEFLLVDRDDGNKVWIWGRPVFSPDNKYFVTYSYDLEAGYDPNGFQLYEIKDKKAILKWAKILEDWGPSDIRWKNDSTVYIEQWKFADESDSLNYTYKSMVIK
jgi:hypothetical protein